MAHRARRSRLPQVRTFVPESADVDVVNPLTVPRLPSITEGQESTHMDVSMAGPPQFVGSGSFVQFPVPSQSGFSNFEAVQSQFGLLHIDSSDTSSVSSLSSGPVRTPVHQQWLGQQRPSPYPSNRQAQTNNSGQTNRRSRAHGRSVSTSASPNAQLEGAVLRLVIELQQLSLLRERLEDEFTLFERRIDSTLRNNRNSNNNNNTTRGVRPNPNGRPFPTGRPRPAQPGGPRRRADGPAQHPTVDPPPYQRNQRGLQRGQQPRARHSTNVPIGRRGPSHSNRCSVV